MFVGLRTDGAATVPSNQPKADFYHQEALRLLTMAESAIFDDVREELERMAKAYQRLAVSAQRRGDNHPDAD